MIDDDGNGDDDDDDDDVMIMAIMLDAFLHASSVCIITVIPI